MSVRGWFARDRRTETRLLRREDRGRRERALVAGSLLAAVGLCMLAAGPIGLVAGLGAAAVWYGLGPAYAVAVGAVLLSALTDGQVRLPVAALALLAFVIAPVVAATDPLRSAAGVVLAAAAFGIEAWLLVAGLPLWVAATLLIGTIAVAVALFDRYHRLMLGLLDADEDEAAGTESGPDTGPESRSGTAPDTGTEQRAKAGAETDTSEMRTETNGDASAQAADHAADGTRHTAVADNERLMDEASRARDRDDATSDTDQ